MRNIFLLVLVIAFSAKAQQTTPQLYIKGTIKGNTKGFNKIYCYGEGVPNGLFSVLKNGTFEFQLDFSPTLFPLLYTEYEIKTKGGYIPFALLVDQPGEINILMEDINKGFYHSKVTGIRSAEVYQSFNNGMALIDDSKDTQLKKMYGTSRMKSDNPAYERLNISRDSLTTILFVPYVKDFFNTHTETYADIFILNEQKELLEAEELSLIYERFPVELKNSEPGKKVSDYIAGIKNSKVGSTLKAFTLNTHEDKPFDIVQLKGKYIVLDFWASWCGPCRESFPHMRKIYTRYKEKNIEFVNISIDDVKVYWLSAVENENLPWIQLLDTKKVALQNFGITSVPTTFLIDPEGKIVMQESGFNPNGESKIEKKLKTLFGF